MSEISKQLDVTELPLTSDENALYAVATATGLTDSEPSNSVTYGGGSLVFELSDTKDYYIITGKGTITNSIFTLPSSYGGLPVKAIGESAFINDGTIKQITIPESIERIEKNAFYNTYLESITFEGHGLKEIGLGAFQNNTRLTEITIPYSVQKIGKSAFMGCTNVTSLTFEEADKITVYFRNTRNWSTVSIYAVANFADGTKTENAAWPGEHMAYCGNNIWRASISKVVSAITFNNGSSFAVPTDQVKADINIENLKCWQPASAAVGDTDTEEYSYAYDENSYIYHNGGLDIGDYAFAELTYIETLRIPDHCKTIGARAFLSTNSLEQIETGLGVTHIGDYAFQRGGDYAEVDTFCFGRVIYGTTSSGQATIYFDTSKLLETIGDCAFSNVYIHASVVIPASVTAIGANAFDRSLTTDGITYSTVTMLDKYGWFSRPDDASDEVYIEPDEWGTRAAQILSTPDTYLYKLEQMVAPTLLPISNDILTIVDSTGIAETFKIYVNNVHRATMNISSGAITLV